MKSPIKVSAKPARFAPQEGSSLIAVFAIIVVLTAMISAAALYTANNARMAHRNVMRERAIGYGNGLLEDLYEQWRTQMVNVSGITEVENGMTWNQLKPGITDPSTRVPAPSGVSLVEFSGTQKYEIRAATPLLATLGDNDRPSPEGGARVDMRNILNYIAKVRIKYTATGTPDAGNYVDVQRVFIRGGSSIFKFFLFSTLPTTEIHPGAPMSIFGRVYADGDLYMAHDTLTLKGQTSYLGKLAWDYFDQDSRKGNDPTIDNDGLTDNYLASSPPAPGKQENVFDTAESDLESRFTDHSNANNTSQDGNDNNDGFREMIETHADTGSGTDPFRNNNDPNYSERLADNADYMVEVNDVTTTTNVYDKKGKLIGTTTQVTGSTETIKARNSDGTWQTLTSGPDYTALTNAITTDKVFQDAREGGGTTNPGSTQLSAMYSGGTMRIVELDVSQISNPKTSSQSAPTPKLTDVWKDDGLTIYIRDNSTASVPVTVSGTTKVNTNRRGVRLKNAGYLPDGGLTLVTPQPVYIWGDYNSGKTSTYSPTSNSNPTANDSATSPTLWDPLESTCRHASLSIL